MNGFQESPTSEDAPTVNPTTLTEKRRRHNEANKKYVELHRERVLKLKKKWRDSNKDKMALSRKNWLEKEGNKERIKVFLKKYYREQIIKIESRREARLFIPLEKYCELCGGKAEERHHPDYNNPLDVAHLCKPCHKDIHLTIKGDANGTYNQ